MERPQDLVRTAGRQAQWELEEWFHKIGLEWIPFRTNSGAISAP